MPQKKYCYICGAITANSKLRHNECAERYNSFHYVCSPMMFSVNTGKKLTNKSKITNLWQCRVDYRD